MSSSTLAPATRCARKSFVAAALALSAIAAQAGGVTYDVFARENSLSIVDNDATPLDTGLSFSIGDALSVTASGTWFAGCGTAFGPTGSAGAGVACGGPLIEATTGLAYFSLAGRIGSGAWFALGDSFSGTATTAGNLFLAFIDSDSFNNSGFVTASVAGGTVPEPGTLGLLLAAAGVSAFVPRRRKSAAA